MIRLRPVVHASPTGDGLHIRGWASAFTLKGGAGLWTLWQRLAPSLAEGVPELAVPQGIPAKTQAALELLFAQLREHDMLVEVPEEWGTDAPPDAVARWLESVAPDPRATWDLIRAAEITITGTPPLVAAARRAIVASGLSALTQPGDGLVVTAGKHAVAAGCADETGFVVHPGALADVVDTAAAVSRRLVLSQTAPPEVLAALVGSAAAHRLLCAAGGLPDPSGEFITHDDSVPPAPPRNAVLVARLDPFRTSYHPWLPAAPDHDPQRTLAALTDAELGPVPTPKPGSLPQLPANVVLAGDVPGIGTTLAAAQIDATIRTLSTPENAAGLDRAHALGNALRLAAHRRHADLPALTLSEVDYTDDPTVRRWWKALTLRFEIAAKVQVTRLDEHAVHAEITDGDHVLAWAVEATPADAVAFATLAAVGARQLEYASEIWLSGAAPLPEPAADVEWATRDWHWPADVRARETLLQAALFRVLGLTTPPVPMDDAGFVRCAVPVLEVAG